MPSTVSEKIMAQQKELGWHSTSDKSAEPLIFERINIFRALFSEVFTEGNG